MNLYACDNCFYLFEADREPEQCPDCGKFAVRIATQAEKEEYEQRKLREDNWLSEDCCHGETV